jgi:hypothetical protein
MDTEGSPYYKVHETIQVLTVVPALKNIEEFPYRPHRIVNLQRNCRNKYASKHPTWTKYLYPLNFNPSNPSGVQRTAYLWMQPGKQVSIAKYLCGKGTCEDARSSSWEGDGGPVTLKKKSFGKVGY